VEWGWEFVRSCTWLGNSSLVSVAFGFDRCVFSSADKGKIRSKGHTYCSTQTLQTPCGQAGEGFLEETQAGVCVLWSVWPVEFDLAQWQQATLIAAHKSYNPDMLGAGRACTAGAQVQCFKPSRV
jgi:hypothetical protein